MNTILITAYAVNPFKGSEDGTGWNWSYQAAKSNKVVVITRKNNIPAIKKYLKLNADPVHDNMEFIGFDLPDYIMKWKKRLGERGYVAYFYLWQMALPRFIKRKKIEFDLAHALNFHSDSTPNFLWKLGKPTVWGPIGHHPKMTRQFVEFYKGASKLKDTIYYAFKVMLRQDPNFRKAVLHSDKIIGINSSIERTIDADSSKMMIMPAVGSKATLSQPKLRRDKFHLLSVGRAHYIKGFDVVIEAFDRFVAALPPSDRPKVKLTIVAKGEEEKALKYLIYNCQNRTQIDWKNWVSKDKMEAIYKNSDAFVFASHEGAGMVIPEAMSFGLPIICFDNYGPGELAGAAGLLVSPYNHAQAISDFTDKMLELYHNELIYEEKSRVAIDRFKKEFDWDVKGAKIDEVYNSLLESQQRESIAVFHPSAELYGADRILVSVLKMMPAETQKVVYLRFDGELEAFLKREVPNVVVKKIPTMPVIYRAIFNPKGLVEFVFDTFSFYKTLKTDHKKFQFKSAYVNTLAMSFVLPLLSRLNISTFTHVHEIIEKPKVVAELTAKLASLYSAKVIAVSNAVKNNLVENDKTLEQKTQVIHNGIAPVLVPQKALDEKVRFYLFGRIMPAKGQLFLVDTLRRIAPSILEKAEFVLVGGTAPRKEHFLDELLVSLEKYELSKYVSIQGFTKDISAAMAKADVCLVPSMMRDPFPTTVLEAMSAGKPVIATNHGGASEAILHGETGFLVNPGNAKELAHYISFYIEQQSSILAHGLKAKQRFNDHFTLNHFKAKWNAFFNYKYFSHAVPNSGILFREQEDRYVLQF